MIVKPFHNVGPLGRCGVFPLPAGTGAGDYLPNGGRGADHCRRTAADWMTAGTGARADAVAKRAEILHRAPVAETAGPDVIHTPGGGPLHTVPSAPAPMRTWNPPAVRSLSKRAAKRAAKYDRETVPVGTVWTMAASAARLTLRGRDWSETDIEDCTAEIVAAVVAAVPVPGADRYPVRFCGYGWMGQRATDWRRAAETRRRADLEATADQGAKLTGHYHDPDPVDTVDGTPHGARRRAVAMLRATGVLPDGEPVRWGPAWTAAYAAARTAANVDQVTGEPVETDPAELAEELELTPNTLKVHRTRGAAAIAKAAGLPVESVRSPLRYGGKLPHADGDQARERVSGAASRYLWRQVFDLPTDDAGRAVKPSKSRQQSSSMGDRANGWRGLDAPRPDALPTRCRQGARRDRRRKLAPPAWAAEVSLSRPRAAVRWERMAQVSRERVESRTPAEREEIRAAAGLPATVR